MISTNSYCLQMNNYWMCCSHFPIYIPAAHCFHLFHPGHAQCGCHDLDLYLDLLDALCFCYLSLYFMNIKCTCTLYQHGLNILSVFILLVQNIWIRRGPSGRKTNFIFGITPCLYLLALHLDILSCLQTYFKTNTELLGQTWYVSF